MSEARRPGEGRYAHLEREQRWLVGRPPAFDGPLIEIRDRYLTGTRLRLRRAENGSSVVHKLGQKVRVDPEDPELVKLTNIYLSDAEYSALTQLGANELSKTRRRIDHDGRVVVVDAFHGALEGLMLAETELSPDEPLVGLPPFALADVTHDDRFSGGALAALSPEAQRGLVAELA